MKFSSKKDALFSIVVIALLLLLGTFVFFMILKAPQHITDYFILIPIIIVFILLTWIFFGTHYVLNHQSLSYTSGPFRGKIEIASIREIIVGQTLWVGLKPATARKGLLIKYNKYDELYISPITNASFIESILNLKSDIKVSQETS
jgi:hypothetical protein